MIVGIVLAAGASTRMGRPKALLPLAGGTFIGQICRSVSAAGIPDLVVVTATGAPSLAHAIESTGVPARIVENPTPADGQLSSLRVGLSVADRPGVDAVIVNLVDVPLVRAVTIRAVADAFVRTRAPIVRPVAQDGRHGHPVLFSRAVFDDLRRASLAEGAKAVLRAHASAILDVPSDDAGAFTDIDTPDDYARAIGSASGT